jgi:hypothetical protein
MATPAVPNPSISTGQNPSVSLKSRVRTFYERHERHTGIAIFALGFAWDSLTMTRVDNLLDNVILLFYLAIIAAMILLTLRRQCGQAPPSWIRKFESRFLWAMQFCFGGLFSSYVIFYFKSASFTRTQFFFLILVLLWIGNEFLEQRLRNQVLLAVLYCFCLFSFFAFFLPVILARVNAGIFFMAGCFSLVISLGVFSIGLLPEPAEWRKRMAPVAASVFATVLGVNVLYFADLIPPVPLALKSAGIYHQVAKTSEGYLVEYVPPSMSRFWRKWDDPFNYSPGESVYCYTAVFAPGKVRVPVRHVWSRKTPHGWVRTDSIGFPISGGREGGYRGYTAKSGITPGKWRVEVETEGGRTLGRIDFAVVPSPVPHPSLVTALIR